MANTYSAGIVTAYGAAVRGGYTGTYEEFCAQQATFAENAEQVAEDRAAVEQLKTTFENQTVPAAVGQVNQAGAAQVQAVQAAGAAEESDIASAGAAQETRVLQAGTDQESAVNAAGTTQVAAVQAAGAAQVTAVQGAGSTQVAAVNAAGGAQVDAVEDKGAEVLASIPQDYSALAGEVDGLKSAIFSTGTETFVNNKKGPYSTNIPTNYLRLYKTPVPAGYTIESIDIYIGTPRSSAKPLFDLTLWKLNDGTLTLDKTFHCKFETTLCDSIQNVPINYDTTAKTYIGIHTIHDNSAFANQDGTGSYYTTDLESTSFQIANLSSSSWGTCMTVNTSYDINTIDNVSEEVKTLKNNIITVGTTGDYSTIQGACNAATSGSTILVYPGTYREHIIAIGKTLHLVGIDKDACIIIDSTGNYNTPPVYMNLGSIRNFTIIEDASDPTGEDISGKVPVTNMAYCIHTDSAVKITNGSELVIDNCNMINANRPCIGAGLYSNYTIKITNCNMYSGVGVQTGYHRGVLYFHNNVQDNVTGQKIIIDNCKCVCADEKALYSLATSAANVGLSVEMTRNIFYSEINGTVGIIEGDLAENYLSDISFGNNLSELNAS